MNLGEHDHPEWRSEEPPAEAAESAERAEETGLARKHAMKPLVSVLVATDFSAGAGWALARAAWLATAPGAAVHLVHVMAPGEGEEAATAAREALQAAAGALTAERARAGGPPLAVRSEVLRGDAYSEISGAGLEHGADVVVVGRHGRRGIAGHFLGSTAEQIVRKGRLPVIVVGESPAGPYRRPLLATAFEEGAERVLAVLLRVTSLSAGQVAVVHAIEEVPADGLLVAGVTPADENQYYEARTAQAVHAMSALGRRFEGCKFELAIRAGVPVSVVIEEVQARGCDLVAVGTRARSGLPRLLLGTTAGSVLREAPCDVLVVPLRD